MLEFITDIIGLIFSVITDIIGLFFSMIRSLLNSKSGKEFTCKLIGIIVVISIAVGAIVFPIYKFFQKTNLEKFNSISVNIEAAGVYPEKLQEQFKKDPLATRISVENHKRKRFMLINKAQEDAITDQIIKQMESKKILWNSRFAQRRCDKILTRLAKVMPENFTPPKKIYFLDTPHINACCLPNGTIIVFKGLLKKFNDDELAFILAHELGHGVAHHSGEMLSKSIIQELAIKSFIDKDSGVLKITGVIIAQFMTNLTYSRTQENEADRLALLFLNKAKFNMEGAVSTLNKFKAEAGENSKWKEWLSTHPHPENRLKNVSKAMADLKNNPDPIWGSKKDDLVEKAKVEAVKYYLNTNKPKAIEDNKSSNKENKPKAIKDKKSKIQNIKQKLLKIRKAKEEENKVKAIEDKKSSNKVNKPKAIKDKKSKIQKIKQKLLKIRKAKEEENKVKSIEDKKSSNKENKPIAIEDNKSSKEENKVKVIEDNKSKIKQWLLKKRKAKEEEKVVE